MTPLKLTLIQTFGLLELRRIFVFFFRKPKYIIQKKIQSFLGNQMKGVAKSIPSSRKSFECDSTIVSVQSSQSLRGASNGHAATKDNPIDVKRDTKRRPATTKHYKPPFACRGNTEKSFFEKEKNKNNRTIVLISFIFSLHFLEGWIGNSGRRRNISDLEWSWEKRLNDGNGALFFHLNTVPNGPNFIVRLSLPQQPALRYKKNAYWKMKTGKTQYRDIYDIFFLAFVMWGYRSSTHIYLWEDGIKRNFKKKYPIDDKSFYLY